MGCVTDISWKLALMEQYPNRSVGSLDSMRRKTESSKRRDIAELAIASTKYECRRIYDAAMIDMKQARWKKASMNHIFDWDSKINTKCLSELASTLTKIRKNSYE